MIGLTGSIGMGKTETGKLFSRLGIPVHGADEVVHRLYDQGGAAVDVIAREFPGTVRDGQVDREALAAKVAGDEVAFRLLEAIVHPLVREAERKFLDDAAEPWRRISSSLTSHFCSRRGQRNAWMRL